jgi:hypothetical protein
VILPIIDSIVRKIVDFTTFTTILGRYNNSHHQVNSPGTREMESCCSVLEQDAGIGFQSNLRTTFTNFASGSRHELLLLQLQNRILDMETKKRNWKEK